MARKLLLTPNARLHPDQITPCNNGEHASLGKVHVLSASKIGKGADTYACNESHLYGRIAHESVAPEAGRVVLPHGWQVVAHSTTC
jgi:hypothetical protein